jgi:hypothetical protein
LRKKILPVHTEQPLYPILFTTVRSLFYIKKAFDHIRFMDFSVLPGRLGYVLWKTGIIKFWKKLFLRQYDLSEYQPTQTKLK